MEVVALLTVAVLAGWLATLILHAEIAEISLVNFSVAIAGALLAGLVLAPSLGISPTGEYGLSLAGTVLAWAGAMTLLAIVNLLRYGRLRCQRRSARNLV